MVEIKFHSDYDATFMLAMIFIHDFLHDFNAVNFSTRMKTIRNSIDNFTKIVSGVSPLSLGGGPKRKKELVIKDKILKNEEDYTEFGVGESVPFLREWCNKVEKESISQLHGLISHTSTFIGLSKTTRERARIIQDIKQLIYESKVFVIGNIRPNGKKGSYKHHCELMRSAFGNAIKTSELEPDLADYFKLMGTLYLFYEKADKNPYDSFNNTNVEHALFLFLLDSERNLIDWENIDSLHLLLQSLEEQYSDYFKLSIPEEQVAVKEEERPNEGKKTGFNPFTRGQVPRLRIPNAFGFPRRAAGGFNQKGGSIDNVESVIETTPEFKPILDVMSGDIELTDLYNIDNTVVNMLKETIDTVLDPLIVRSDDELMLVVNDKTYRNTYKRPVDSEHEYFMTALNPRRGDRDDSKVKKFKIKVLDNIIKLFAYVYRTIVDHKIRLLERAEKEEARSNSGSLTPDQRGNVQMISVTVASGGKRFILGDNISARTVYQNNTLLQSECEIIENIIAAQRVPGSIDENIRDAFKRYASGSPKYLGNINSIKDAVASIKSPKKGALNVVAINNAASDALDYIEIEEQSRICPISSVNDAQGTFGSCYPLKRIYPANRKEFNPMDFVLRNDNESNPIYYHGKTEVTNNSGKWRTRVTYEAQINEFYLPEVEVIIDVTEGQSVLTLSANETFKTLLSAILGIWRNLFAKRPQGSVSSEMMWDSLINNQLIFSELVSCGSLKSVGDLFQEVNSVAEGGAYTNGFNISNQYRVGANGDQPSGVRAGYILLRAFYGININSMAGYLAPADSAFAIRGDVGSPPAAQPSSDFITTRKAVKVPTAAEKRAATVAAAEKRAATTAVATIKKPELTSDMFGIPEELEPPLAAATAGPIAKSKGRSKVRGRGGSNKRRTLKILTK
jgi:hypothetical protein